MHTNKSPEARTAPFSVVVLDMTDRYYYADVIEEGMELYKQLDDYEKAVALADALFVVKNHGWESLQAMNELDAGYDVRVYNSEMSCLYAAHEKYIQKWIGEADTRQNNAHRLLYSSRVQQAIRFSIKTHEVYQKQKRKGKDVPYITHPLTVGLILARAGADEDIVIAGILHDTIEDSVPEKKVTREMLTERFGEKVASIVENVTEPDKKLPWEERKQAAYERIATFDKESLLVKAADIIHNTTECLGDYEREGPAFFAAFNSPADKLFTHYARSLEAILKRWPEHPLAQDLAEAKIQLARFFALGQGNLQYAEWCISFIEYEMKRVFSGSKYNADVMTTCADFHAAIRAHEVTNDIAELQTNVHGVADRLHKVIEATDGDEKESMMQFLLTSHFADMLNSFRAYLSEKRE